MQRCSRCLLPETYPRISFNKDGICNFCSTFTGFVAPPEKVLINYLKKAKSKKKPYDVLVPFSGGKDSSYVLYLAKKVHGLNVLAYTLDNGFFTDTALGNIKSALETLNVDHIFIKPDWHILKRLYRGVLMRTGELCAVCSIGILVNALKISEERRIPLILDGSSAMESNSGSPERISDLNRFKAILKDIEDVSTKEKEEFMIYNNLSPIRLLTYSKIGKFGKTVSPLHFLPRVTEDEMSNTLKKEVSWKEDTLFSQQKKHFDCLAEPFTNYIREKRFGYSRRVCQYSNLIRLGELTREEAQRRLSEEVPEIEPDTTDLVLEKLELSRDEFNQILKLPLSEYNKYCYQTPKLLKFIYNIFSKQAQ